MRTFFTVVIVAFTTVAAAQDYSAALECARIDDSLRRLTCFDAAFPRATASQPTEKGARPSSGKQWEFSEDRSAIDDSLRVTAGMIPKNVTYTGIGDGSAFLLLRCSDNTTSVILSTSMFMSDDTVSVTTRMGDEQASTSRWSRSSDYKAVGLWSGSQAIPFIRQLVHFDRLAVRIQARDRLDAQFDLGNVTEAAQKVATACNWPIDG